MDLWVPIRGWFLSFAKEIPKQQYICYDFIQTHVCVRENRKEFIQNVRAAEHDASQNLSKEEQKENVELVLVSGSGMKK